MALLALFGPALFGGRVLFSGDILPGVAVDADGKPLSDRLGNPLHLDVVTQIVPLEAEVRRALRDGRWPQWNADSGAGMPLLADPQAQALQPLVALALPLPLARALAVTAGVRVLLPLLFLFLFLRRIGLETGPALFGALSFSLSGAVLLWLGWPMANSAAWLPAVLYALLLSAQRGERRDYVLLTLALAGALLAGHPETALYVGGAAFLLALAILRRRPVGRRGALTGRWLLSAGIACGLAAPALLPLASYLAQSHRSALLERRNALLVHPRAQRTDAARSAPAAETIEAPAPWRRLRESLSPWLSARERAVTGEDNRNENAMGFAGTLAWLGTLLALLPTRRRMPFERLFCALALGSLAIVARPPGLERLFAPFPVLGQSATWHHRLLLLVALSCSILAACFYQRAQRRLSAYRAPLSLLLPLLAGIELIATFRADNPALPLERFYPSPPAVAFLQAHLRPGERIAGLGDRLWPNSAAVYGLADPRLSNPLKPYRYTASLAPLVRSVRDTEDVYRTPEHPLYQLLGVRYLLTPPRLQRSPGQRAVFRDAGGRILERERFLPPLFLPTASTPDEGVDEMAWLAANPDFATLAYAPTTPGHAVPWRAAEPEASRLMLGGSAGDEGTKRSARGAETGRTERSPGSGIEPARLRGHLLLTEERLLASSLYQDGGWRLLLDGRPRATLQANGPFLAAWLPAGEHELEALYRAPGLAAGLALAALALALGACLWVPQPG